MTRQTLFCSSNRIRAVAAILAIGWAPSFVKREAAGSASQPKAIDCVSVENAPTRLEDGFGKLPLYFVENRGQMDSRVSYYVAGKQTSIYFAADGITYALGETVRESVTHNQQRWILKLDFVDASQTTRPVGCEPTDAVVSYFKGPKSHWTSGVHTYSRIEYHELWPGIDLVYTGISARLKYEFHVHPGADPGQIRLSYRGASGIAVSDEGRLRVTTGDCVMEDERPVSYQFVAGRQVEVESSFTLSPGPGDSPREYGFSVGEYDRNIELVIDPATLVYAGYIGGSLPDSGSGIAVDAEGNAYVTGRCESTEETFPVAVGPDVTFNGGELGAGDAFVAKINASGTALEYAGYIGGAGRDQGNGIAVDRDGNVYVVGSTDSLETSFPVAVGPDLTFNGGSNDMFIAKVNSSGTMLEYAGYVGGSSDDSFFDGAIAVDSSGCAYITGTTSSSEDSFPVRIGPDLTYNGDGYDAFVAKIDATGASIVYAGYIGGSGRDFGGGIAVDGSGNAYVAGSSGSSEATFPVSVGPDLTFNGGGQVASDGFVAKVSVSGSELVYAGYIGGAGYDGCTAIAVDHVGNVYVAGSTDSTEATFPVKVGPDLTNNGGEETPFDAFVAEVNTDGTALVFAGFIGGDQDEFALAIAVDASGNSYVTGFTTSAEATFPVRVGPDLTFNGFRDAFIAKVSPGGLGLVFAGYIGGDANDSCAGIAVDAQGNTYLVGATASTQSTFPVTIGPDLTIGGSDHPFDAIVAKVRALTLLVQATLGTAYSTRVEPSAGTPPHTFMLAAGQLPVGLMLSVDGAIRGTPTAPGQSFFTVRVTDSAGATVEMDLTICVGIEVTSARYRSSSRRLEISSASFDGSIPLTGITVEVNGETVSPPLRSSYKASRLLLRVGGSKGKLNLRRGSNTVVVTVSGCRSAPLTLRL